MRPRTPKTRTQFNKSTKFIRFQMANLNNFDFEKYGEKIYVFFCVPAKYSLGRLIYAEIQYILLTATGYGFCVCVNTETAE